MTIIADIEALGIELPKGRYARRLFTDDGLGIDLTGHQVHLVLDGFDELLAVIERLVGDPDMDRRLWQARAEQAEAALVTARQGELEAMTILEGTEAKLAAAEAQRCDTCAHCAGCDIQQLLSPFVEDWGDTFCSSWTDRKQEP